MYHFINNQKESTKEVFLVHGEEETQHNFRSFLMDKGFSSVHVPFLGKEYEL
jgi:hypothetical protein